MRSLFDRLIDYLEREFSEKKVNEMADVRATYDDSFTESLAETAGNYYVQVADAGLDSTGSHEFEVSAVPSSVFVEDDDQGGALVNGTAIEATLTIGDIDTWTIKAQEGGYVLASLGETDNGNGLAPNIRLISPSGEILKEDSASADVIVGGVASESGT